MTENTVLETEAEGDVLVAASNFAATAPATEVMESSIPGWSVPANKFVVLTSRLGRPMVKQDKLDPTDADEKAQWMTPESFERGQIIDITDLYTGKTPGYRDNVDRLIHLRAICRLDDPEAQAAINELRYRDNKNKEAAERQLTGRS